ncbi:hypothetical protein PV328_003993 [Microctonus aethiopoides]|uniref:F-box domain-containing protein n=1 Tax=Microctonus aethiopoides TaxID=144406 RepID=A0AA39F9N9_9HYME|nr:hypothetical protein PV328_003993 [Microctonus aethiopoides]
MDSKPIQMSADFVDVLPIELSQMVLRHLDGLSLMNAAKVSQKWRNVCRGDPRLRQTAQSHIREERRVKLKREMPHDSSEVATKYRRTSSTSTVVAIFFEYPEEVSTYPPVGQNIGARKILAPKRSKNVNLDRLK